MISIVIMGLVLAWITFSSLSSTSVATSSGYGPQEIRNYETSPSLSNHFILTDIYSGEDRCSWLEVCICRDESKYTNGTYMLMVNCTQSGLSDVPHSIPNTTTVLTLDGNSIQNIKPGAFKHLIYLKYLDLSDNTIRSLNEGIFEGLENLKTLELSGNKIRYDESSLPNAVFKPLTKLIRLNLHQNLANVDKSEIYPTKALYELKQLKQLLIDGIEPENISFSYMTTLTTVDLSSEYGRCNLKNITVDMFRNLVSVTYLKITNCSLNYVDEGSFSELKKLTNLDLSYNEKLHFKSLPNITFGLIANHIRELRLVKIHGTYGDCTRIEADHLLYLKHMEVDNIYLDDNRLAYVSEEAVPNIPRTIQKLSVTNNMLLAGEYIHKIFEQSVFKNLKYLTMAEQNMNYDALKFFNNKTRHMLKTFTVRTSNTVELGHPVASYASVNNRNKNLYQINAPGKTLDNDSVPFCSNCYSQNIQYDIILYFPEKLKDLDLSGLRIRNELKNICICEPNSLIRINLERNVFWNWQGPIGGLSNLLNLNLAWNSCDNLSQDVFDQMTSLMELNLTRNFIERFLREDINGRIFKNLKNVNTLLLGDNKLRFLPPKLFQGLVSLKGLDLSYNFLTFIDVEFPPTASLQYFNLYNNLLKKLGPNILKKYDDSAKMNVSFKIFYLDLSSNKLSCTCDDIDFIGWVSRTNVCLLKFNEYTCTYKNGKQKKLAHTSTLYQELLKDCADYSMLIIFSCLSLVLFLVIIVGGVIYRYRWDLRYFYYSIKLRLNGHKILINQNDERKYRYDAFISYASENARFVKNELVPELEDTRQLQLLVHDRDFRAGEFVNDNIMQAITTSRKTLILMSKDFLKSEWCIFEMNMARMDAIKTGRNVVCLVMLEEVPVAGLPLEIMDIIRQQTYLELPKNACHMDLFWDRVKNALKE